MTIRITTLTEDEATTIRAEGRLEAESLPCLLEECLEASKPLRLDLSGLSSVDDEGVRALCRLIEQGAELSGASIYIRRLLFGNGE